MAAPVPLRPDFDAAALRALAKSSRDPDQTRRLLALSAIYAGGSRSEAAALGGVGLQTVRDFRPGLQRRWAGWAHRRQGSRRPPAVERGFACRAEGPGRARSGA